MDYKVQISQLKHLHQQTGQIIDKMSLLKIDAEHMYARNILYLLFSVMRKNLDTLDEFLQILNNIEHEQNEGHKLIKRIYSKTWLANSSGIEISNDNETKTDNKNEGSNQN